MPELMFFIPLVIPVFSLSLCVVFRCVALGHLARLSCVAGCPSHTLSFALLCSALLRFVFWLFSWDTLSHRLHCTLESPGL